VARAKMVHEYVEAHPERRRQHAAAKPKIKNHCGACVAFHTPFCLWEYKDLPDRETEMALHVDAEAYACSSFYPFKARAHECDSEKQFERRVAALE
jgi:hypothetical protein